MASLSLSCAVAGVTCLEHCCCGTLHQDTNSLLIHHTALSYCVVDTNRTISVLCLLSFAMTVLTIGLLPTEHHWHWRTGKMNRKWASGPTKWEFEFDSGQESHSDEDRTSRGSEGEFRGWEEAGPGGMTWNPAMFQHLRVLGLPKSAQLDGKKLRDAFYRCALAWHPDRHQGSEKNSAEAKFKAAQAAYHALRAHVSSR
ncbi:unnamed protein product [Ostreobium quekettii]|uniref:J domain-containing protein n=1 Tax=Ostreobium quekettii TaxID=121088 RepID=A0A8S1J4L0_9CHLO|nr:unnamed protein product [Ostreobium quekettii]